MNRIPTKVAVEPAPEIGLSDVLPMVGRAMPKAGFIHGVLAAATLCGPALAGDAPVLDPAILEIEGDAAFGEYLAGECMTCHSAAGAARGIPSITGWPTVDFVTAMHAYKQKTRDNPVMQTMAGRLNEEEIAALAAYFMDLE